MLVGGLTLGGGLMLPPLLCGMVGFFGGFSFTISSGGRKTLGMFFRLMTESTGLFFSWVNVFSEINDEFLATKL